MVLADAVAPLGRRSSVVVVSGSVGAGHDGVANELARRLTEQGQQVDVVDLLEGFPRLVAVLLGSGYLLTLRLAPWLYEATCWLVERSRLFQRVADAVCCSATPWLREQVDGADLVVATYPPAARALGRMRARGLLQVPVVTYLTDPAPNFLWVHPSVDLHLAMSRATAEEATATYGVPVLPAGPLVRPDYRGADTRQARRHLRTTVRADPQARVAVLVLGSLGVGDVRSALTALRRAGLVPVVLCGRNDRLRRRLARLPGVVALGWRTDAPSLVAGADLVVHNAGGLSLTESLVAGVPSVTYAPLPGHGRANARTLERSGMVRWAHTPEQLTSLAALPGSRPQWPASDETAVGHVLDLLAAQRSPRVHPGPRAKDAPLTVVDTPRVTAVRGQP